MKYVRQFVSSYEDSGIPYFGFSFLAELSHEYLSRVASADEDYEDFFKFLHDGGHLKNTVLIVMSDHGHRFDAIRTTQVTASFHACIIHIYYYLRCASKSCNSI